jgi:hypothetical protein
MGIEPVSDAADVVDAVLRLSATGELVRVVLEPHEHGFPAEQTWRRIVPYMRLVCSE